MVFVIFGGGCYGTFYTRQLLRAADAGALTDPEIIVIDRNDTPKLATELPYDSRVRLIRNAWEPFLEDYLGSLSDDADDQIVPPPFTPHLAVAWLLGAVRRARPDVTWTVEPFALLPATPFQRQADNGTLTVSHADWICPVHCIEPAVCPETRGPRFWDMSETVKAFARSLNGAGQSIEQVHLLQCLHFTHGVGTYAAAGLPAALRQLQAVTPSIDAPSRALIGTVSRCHGALHLLSGSVGTDTVSRNGTSKPAEAGGLLPNRSSND